MIPKRRKGETLIDWLDRIRIRQLDDEQFCDALWTSDLISNIKRLEKEYGEPI